MNMGAKHSKDSEMEENRRILEAAISASPDIKARLTKLGFDTAELQSGYSLYKAAGGADIAVFHQSGEQRDATLDVNLLRDKLDIQVCTLTRIANEVFADNV